MLENKGDKFQTSTKSIFLSYNQIQQQESIRKSTARNHFHNIINDHETQGDAIPNKFPKATRSSFLCKNSGKTQNLKLNCKNSRKTQKLKLNCRSRYAQQWRKTRKFQLVTADFEGREEQEQRKEGKELTLLADLSKVAVFDCRR